jgi:hypothetical protein
LLCRSCRADEQGAMRKRSIFRASRTEYLVLREALIFSILSLSPYFLRTTCAYALSEKAEKNIKAKSPGQYFNIIATPCLRLIVERKNACNIDQY